MATPTSNTASDTEIRIAEFLLDTRTGELQSDGRKTLLTAQVLEVLLALAERPGELVTREELVARLWPAGTFVDFDHSLNKAVNKLRDTLGDSADRPSYIETLPRRGYRLIAPVSRNSKTADASPPAPVNAESSAGATELPTAGRNKKLYILLALCAALAISGSFAVPGLRRAVVRGLRPANPRIMSMAVLPLENLSGEAEQGYFAEGMTDTLITEIAKVGAIRVISRTSVMRYKSTRKSVQQVAHELNVDAIVEGTILRSGDRVRITAQLIQAATDMHLWAESYEGNVREVLELQREVATDIARQIGVVVRPMERPRTVNPVAYGAFLKGRFYFLQYKSEGWLKAIEYYNQAIAADPEFGPAYAGLAEAYLVARGWNAFPPDEALQKGKAAALRAMQFDDTLATSHLAMAAVYYDEWDWEKSAKEFDRALELAPNDSMVWQQHGNYLLSDGRFEEAIAEQERARTLDPLSPVINANLARNFYYARRYDDAIAQAQATLKIEPKYPIALMYLERAYRQKRMFDEAVAARLAASKPDEAQALQNAFRAAGYRGVLLVEADIYKKQVGALVDLARVYAQAGDEEKALSALEECYRRQWSGLQRLKIDPDFDPIRSSPRYQELMQKMGFKN